jgi:hypothetical protein
MNWSWRRFSRSARAQDLLTTLTMESALSDITFLKTKKTESEPGNANPRNFLGCKSDNNSCHLNETKYLAGRKSHLFTMAKLRSQKSGKKWNLLREVSSRNAEARRIYVWVRASGVA